MASYCNQCGINEELHDRLQDQVRALRGLMKAILSEIPLDGDAQPQKYAIILPRAFVESMRASVNEEVTP
jgi:hypothetical protein